MRNWIKWKTWHKWMGVPIALMLLFFSVTGIIMNHRDLLASFDVKRSNLPANYTYQNWNNAAVKGGLTWRSDSLLVFGNIGIWLTDTSYASFTPLMQGMKQGSDHQKILDLHLSAKGHLYAATLFGCQAYDETNHRWVSMPFAQHERVVGIENVGDTLYVLSRSHLFKGYDAGIRTHMTQMVLQPAQEMDGKVTLFEVLWQTHSGEIFGLPGKLWVDMLGLIAFFLSLTGLIYFIFPKWIKRRKKHRQPVRQIAAVNKWSILWHNKLGVWVAVCLLVLFITGMFLRPPLLIAIAQARVAPPAYSNLDQPNPWHDQLRDLHFDAHRNQLLLSTSTGMYQMDLTRLKPMRMQHQPPISVMGINALIPTQQKGYLVGSFSGLFEWNPDSALVINHFDGKPYKAQASGKPVGDVKVTGYVTWGEGKNYVFDYDLGVRPLGSSRPFPKMPESIRQASGLSVWNLCLEIHTGRFFQFLLGDFYILLVPLTGLFGILVLVSGYFIWKKKYKHKTKKQ